MKLEIKGNANYSATVVELKTFYSAEGLDNLVFTNIFGNKVLVSKNTTEGVLGIFVPVATRFSQEFLGENNLYRDSEYNKDKTKKGFFDLSGRVKAVKFKGHMSEGFFIELKSLSYLGNIVKLKVGDTFDTIDGKKVCEKYISPENQKSIQKEQKKTLKKTPKEERVILSQLRLHKDANPYWKNIHQIKPDDIITIGNKIHGTSFVVSHVLGKKKLSWKDKLFKFFGVNIAETEYQYFTMSRKVYKDKYFDDNQNKNLSNSGFYGPEDDIWLEAKKELTGKLPKGYTVYGEIVGYTPKGKPIQKGYMYGCTPNNHKLYVYRITVTNVDGDVLDLSTNQCVEFCSNQGLEFVPIYFQGKPTELVPMYWETEPLDDWQARLFEHMKTSFNLEKDCEYNPGMPAEGVVIRREHGLGFDVYKLKSNRFFLHEEKMLESGEEDIEEQTKEVMDEN